MIVLTVFVAIAFALAAVGRGTRIGELLFEALVVRPAVRLNRGGLATAAYFVALGMLGVFVIAAPIAPELLAFAVTLDLGLFVELAVLVFVGQALVWSRVARKVLLARPAAAMRRLFRAAGRAGRRATPARRGRAPPPDPEPWGWAAA